MHALKEIKDEKHFEMTSRMKHEVCHKAWRVQFPVEF